MRIQIKRTIDEIAEKNDSYHLRERRDRKNDLSRCEIRTRSVYRNQESQKHSARKHDSNF